MCVCYKVNSKRHRNRSAAGHHFCALWLFLVCVCVCVLQSKLQKASKSQCSTRNSQRAQKLSTHFSQCSNGNPQRECVCYKVNSKRHRNRSAARAVWLVCYSPARRRCCFWASSRASGSCPGASVSVVCALRGSLSRPRWEPCPCVWCLGGTGGGVM